MKTCYYCGNELFSSNYVRGIDVIAKNHVVACQNCSEENETFVKDKYDQKDVFMRFYIKWIEDDPCSPKEKLVISKNFYEVYEYAKKEFGSKLIGIEFDQYVSSNGFELTYYINCWIPII